MKKPTTAKRLPLDRETLRQISGGYISKETVEEPSQSTMPWCETFTGPTQSCGTTAP